MLRNMEKKGNNGRVILGMKEREVEKQSSRGFLFIEDLWW